MLPTRMLFFLCLSLSLLSCDNDENIIVDTGISVIFNIENAYVDSRLMADIVLTDSLGEVMEVVSVQNNQTFEFDIQPETKTFISFVQKYQPDDGFVVINTFEVIEDMTINLAKNPDLNNEETSISVDLGNLEFENIISNTLRLSGSNGMYSAVPYVFPADMLMTLNVAGEPKRKVYYKENLDPSFSDMVTLDDLTDVADSTVIQFDNTGSYFSELNVRVASEDAFFYLASRASGQSISQLRHYLPTADFDDFLLETVTTEDSKKYYTKEHFTDFDFTYTKPDIEFEATPLINGRVKLEQTGTCNFYTIFQRDFDTDVNVLWNFNGKFEQNVHLSIPNLEAYLKTLHSSYELSNMNIIHTEGYRIEEPFDFSDFVEMKTERYLNLKYRTNKIECLEKEL